MTNILLIYPEPEMKKCCRFGFSLTLLYISSILKKQGYNVVLKDYSLEIFNIEDFTSLLPQIDVAIVEFDSFPLKRTLNINNASFILKQIKQTNGQVKTIAFGHDCELLPRKIEYADCTIIGEAEAAIHKVVESLLNDLDGENNSYVSERLDNLDDLPIPDRTILPVLAEYGETIYNKGKLSKSTLIQTARGCLNTCTFCQRRGWSNTYRMHSIEYVLNEFSYLKNQQYINIWITDDNFTFNLPRAKLLLSKLIKSKLTETMKIAFSSWTHIDYEFLDIAKAAGVSVISFGVESANENILSYYNKRLDLEKTEKLINYSNSIGLYSVGNFIIGAPMETADSIKRTFEYAMRVPFDQVNVKILDYMIGSKLYDSLPDSLKNGERHIFACLENGLNNFGLQDLKNQISMFNKIFKEDRRSSFIKKSSQYGLPYQLGTL